MTQKVDPEELVDLPGPFTFKVIANPLLVDEARILTMTAEKLGRDLGDAQLTSVDSRNGKYRSYSLKIHIEAFHEIENLYQGFRSISGVAMVL